MKAAPPLVSLMAAAALSSAPAAGQGRLLVQGGGATSLPGPEAVGDAALYGVGGFALDWTGERSAAVASIYGGLAADESSGADFGTATLDLEGWWSPGTAVGLAGRASAFRVQDPFTYQTSAFRAGPMVRWVRGRFTALLRTEIGTGSTLAEVRRPSGRVRRSERGLWSRAIDLDVTLRGTRWEVGTTMGTAESIAGVYRRLEASTTWMGERWAIRLDTGAWETPLGTEWTGGLALVLPLGGSGTAVSTVGRAAPDPLTLVGAGDQGGVLLGWALASFGGPPAPLTTLELTDTGATVHFRLDGSPARDAAEVELLGDFTAWSPTSMQRDGDSWIATLPVTPGVHHYGFRIDGTWYVPDELPGNVPDEWGRTNATLVVSDPAGGLR